MNAALSLDLQVPLAVWNGRPRTQTKGTWRAGGRAIGDASGADWSPCSVAKRPFRFQWVFIPDGEKLVGTMLGGDQVVRSYKTCRVPAC